jgi:hypothetical protein
MKPATTEKVKRYALVLVGVSAHLMLVFALFVEAVGLDLSKVSFT